MIYSFHRYNIICSCAPHLQIIHRWTLPRHYLCNVIAEQWTRSGYMCKWLIYLCLMIYCIRVDFYWMNFPFVNRAFHQCSYIFNNDARNSFRFCEPVTRYSYSFHLVMINSRIFIQSIKHKENKCRTQTNHKQFIVVSTTIRRDETLKRECKSSMAPQPPFTLWYLL